MRRARIVNSIRIYTAHYDISYIAYMQVWNEIICILLSFQTQLLDIHTLEPDINLYVYLTIDVVYYVFGLYILCFTCVGADNLFQD
jgi:hypothetical protein